jgi:hypothetical protein
MAKKFENLDPASLPLQPTDGVIVTRDGVELTRATVGDILDLVPDPTAPVTSVNGETGSVVLDKTDIGLSNVNNTADSAKPVSIAQAAAIAQSITDLKAESDPFPAYLTQTEGDARYQPIGSGGNSTIDIGSKVGASVSDSFKAVDVTEKLYVTQDATATTAALRLKYESDTRTELIVRNPVTNTVTIRLGLVDADNVINANGSFATAFTIAPGRQKRLTFDRRQVFIKQDQAGVVADQFVIVTERQVIS